MHGIRHVRLMTHTAPCVATMVKVEYDVVIQVHGALSDLPGEGGPGAHRLTSAGEPVVEHWNHRPGTGRAREGRSTVEEENKKKKRRLDACFSSWPLYLIRVSEFSRSSSRVRGGGGVLRSVRPRARRVSHLPARMCSVTMSDHDVVTWQTPSLLPGTKLKIKDFYCLTESGTLWPTSGFALSVWPGLHPKMIMSKKI